MTDDQINRAVHEALGHTDSEHLCADDSDNVCLCCDTHPDFKPIDCSFLEGGGTWDTCSSRHRDCVPNYIEDPRLQEPLEIELLKAGWKIEYLKCDGDYCIDPSNWVDTYVTDKHLGVCKCLAWLKMKGVED